MSDGKVHKVHSIMRVQHLFLSILKAIVYKIYPLNMVNNDFTLYLQDTIFYTYGSGIMNTCSGEYQVETANNLEGRIIT